MTIQNNISQIRQRIDAACLKAGRDPQTVHLLAVSKKKPLTDIETAAAAGQKMFGENYVQEFVGKYEECRSDVSWHFIGALQSNKVKYLRGKVDLIHSVDRLSLAKEINRQWAGCDTPARILIQVNIGNEETKAGTTADQLEDLVQKISSFPNLNICGLMAIPPHSDNPEDSRRWFRAMRQLADSIDALKLANVSMTELSMGMSDDFEIAIEEGATLIRIGTAIFGERDYA
jgi:pyridoxal phosphate enzyme (YggS family)